MLVIVLDCLSRKTISWSDHPNSLGNCSLPMLLSESHATSAAESHCQTPATSPQIKNWNTFYSGYFSIGKHIIGFKTSWKIAHRQDFHSPKIYFQTLNQKQKYWFWSKKSPQFISQSKYQVSYHAANVKFIILSDFWPHLSGKLSPRVSQKKVRNMTSELVCNAIHIAPFKVISLRHGFSF